MLMKRGFSTEALYHIKANTKVAQNYELSDENLVDLDEYGQPVEASDEQAKFTETISGFLPENENEANTLAMTAWPNVEQYGNAFSDPFWAAINYWETRGYEPVTVENINEAISVGMKAAEGNKSQEITQEIASGVPPLDTIPSNLMFG